MKDKFYEKLKNLIDSTYVHGNNNHLNGRVGKNNRGIEKIMGTERERIQNSNGKRLIELRMQKSLIIPNKIQA